MSDKCNYFIEKAAFIFKLVLTTYQLNIRKEINSLLIELNNCIGVTVHGTFGRVDKK